MDVRYRSDNTAAQLKRKPVQSSRAITNADDEPQPPANHASEPLLYEHELHTQQDPVRRNSTTQVPVSNVEDALSRTDSSDHTSNTAQAQQTISEKPTNGDKPPNQGGGKNSIWLIVNGWWQEILCCLLGLASLVALVLILRKYDGQPLPNWSSGITLNTVIAFLSTIARTAFIVPVTEGLAQAKWTWFKKKPRPLEDFEAFDQASRGPWGSLNLLARTKGWLIGILAALLLSSTIATSTLTQSAVTYPSRERSSDNNAGAAAWKVDQDWAFNIGEIGLLNRPVYTRGIAQGLNMLPTESLPFRQPECQAANCTWPAFSTLAVCHKATNVTHLLQKTSGGRDVDPVYSLPNKVSMTLARAMARYTYAETAVLSSGDSISHEDLGTARIWTYFGIHWLPAYSNYPQATEVSFHWCVNTYKASVTNNRLSVEKVASHAEGSSDQNKAFEFLMSPSDGNTKYYFPRGAFSDVLNTVLSGDGSKMSDQPFRGTSSAALHIQAAIDINQTYFEDAQQIVQGLSLAAASQQSWWDAVDGTARNVATGLTNSLLEKEANVQGTVKEWETYVQVRWPWLALLSSQILLSLILLVAVIVETWQADMDIIKTSTLPALFAISGDEKMKLESRIAEGEKLLGKNEAVYVPKSIGGALHNKAGKWMLASI